MGNDNMKRKKNNLVLISGLCMQIASLMLTGCSWREKKAEDFVSETSIFSWEEEYNKSQKVAYFRFFFGSWDLKPNSWKGSVVLDGNISTTKMCVRLWPRIRYRKLSEWIRCQAFLSKYWKVATNPATRY